MPPTRDTSVLDSGATTAQTQTRGLEKDGRRQQTVTQSYPKKPSPPLSTSRESSTIIPPGNNGKIKLGEPLKEEKQRVTLPTTP